MVKCWALWVFVRVYCSEKLCLKVRERERVIVEWKFYSLVANNTWILLETSEYNVAWDHFSPFAHTNKNRVALEKFCKIVINPDSHEIYGRDFSTVSNMHTSAFPFWFLLWVLVLWFLSHSSSWMRFHLYYDWNT